MRKSRTLDWIEQAEAMRVLTDAAFEEASQPSWLATANEALAGLCTRLRGWLLPLPPFGSPASQLQVVRVRAARPRSACDGPAFPGN
jgi:hypothetical protein